MAVGGGVAETPAGVVRAGMTRGDDDSDGSMDNLKMDSRMAGHGKKRKMFSRLHGMLLLSPRPGIDFGHETSSPQTGKHLKREQHAAAQMNAVSSAVANAGQTLGTPGAPPAMRKRPERGTPLRSCKIRMLTWNMHDSLPKGDLSTLFGNIPNFGASTTTLPSSPDLSRSFPTFEDDGKHPYHIVVVSGQECPTSSGIPMGLAANFKIHESEREKLKDLEKDEEDEEPSKSKEDLLSEGPPSSWTDMVEDWLCGGAGCLNRNMSPTVDNISPPKPLVKKSPSKDIKCRRGPYQLLVKERLMGIYMAIYVHRDVKPFVRGFSKDTVAAGLIGGRVGNKGGVGISLNVDGTTFLFVNAHLTAHEEKIQHRIANLAKIKAELEVDDFLAEDDPRHNMEDLTDKFDFTFLCGDLNFRTDLSRLHADWLISHKEYAKAFQFDQLYRLMKEGKHFIGFNEAPIDFPPTFKYDVLRTLKSKRGSSRHAEKFNDRPDAIREEHLLDHDGLESSSIISSIRSSIDSKAVNTDGGHEDPYFASAPSIADTQTLAQAASSVSAVHRTRTKWISVLSPITPGRKKHKHASTTAIPPSPLTPSLLQVPQDVKTPSTSSVKKKHLPSPLSSSFPQLPNPLDPIDETKGVYDSSSKQRVPSWCDRILWKTTLEPDPEPELVLEPLPSVGTPTNTFARMGQFIVNAFSPRAHETTQHAPDAQPTPVSVHETSTAATHPSTPYTGRGSQRKANTLLPSPRNSAFSHEPSSRRSTADTPNSKRLPTTVTSPKWRIFSPFSQPPTPTVVADPPPPPPALPRRRKGDVVCLEYTTLDDQGTRRLEGRSDHRPVIGSYAVYM